MSALVAFCYEYPSAFAIVETFVLLGKKKLFCCAHLQVAHSQKTNACDLQPCGIRACKRRALGKSLCVVSQTFGSVLCNLRTLDKLRDLQISGMLFCKWHALENKLRMFCKHREMRAQISRCRKTLVLECKCLHCVG